MKTLHGILPKALSMALISALFLSAQAQGPPTEYAIHLSYQLETSSINGLPASIDSTETGLFQLSRYRKREQTKGLNTYVTTNGTFYTEIDYTASENPHPDWMTSIGKVIIDETKTSVYDQQGNLKEEVVHSELYNNYNTILGQIALLAPENYGQFPYESNLDAAKIASYEDRGYTVEILSADRYNLTRTFETIKVDVSIGSYQIHRYDDLGNLASSEQNLYQPNAQGQLVPSYRLTKVYHTDGLGNCYVNMDIQNYSNYQVELGDELPQSRAASPSLQGTTIELFPNPTTGFTSILLPKSKSEINTWKVMVWDAMGNRLLSRSINGQVTTPIDISTLPKGVYLVKALDGKAVLEAKIVKQ